MTRQGVAKELARLNIPHAELRSFEKGNPFVTHPTDLMALLDAALYAKRQVRRSIMVTDANQERVLEALCHLDHAARSW